MTIANDPSKKQLTVYPPTKLSIDIEDPFWIVLSLIFFFRKISVSIGDY